MKIQNEAAVMNLDELMVLVVDLAAAIITLFFGQGVVRCFPPLSHIEPLCLEVRSRCQLKNIDTAAHTHKPTGMCEASD